MKLKIYQVAAFTDQAFKGNPAAVCLLPNNLPDRLLQQIAAENYVPETAFLLPAAETQADHDYQIRWFTPTTEVDLCGHATLAAAYVLFNQLNTSLTEIRFSSKSGMLSVRKAIDDMLTLDFPARPAIPVTDPTQLNDLSKALGAEPEYLLRARDYLAVFNDEATVRDLAPNFAALSKLPVFGTIATAPGREYDCVSRFFAPAQGIDEDPVTGSAYCTVVPYFAKRLGKQKILAYQASSRGGTLTCELIRDRVLICGQCSLYLEGEINLPDTQ